MIPNRFYADLMATVPLDLEGISAAERPRRVQELERRIAEAEYVEEDLIVRAEAEGLQVTRRIDASPYAVLGMLAPSLELLLLQAAE